jgi:hypothetical protein
LARFKVRRHAVAGVLGDEGAAGADLVAEDLVVAGDCRAHLGRVRFP